MSAIDAEIFIRAYSTKYILSYNFILKQLILNIDDISDVYFLLANAAKIGKFEYILPIVLLGSPGIAIEKCRNLISTLDKKKVHKIISKSKRIWLDNDWIFR